MPVLVRPKIGVQVRVKESVHFPNRFGTVVARNRRTITVQFGDQIGIYTLANNTILPLVWRLPMEQRMKP